MWRRIKKWWKDNALLLFAQGLVKVLSLGFRVNEEFAPPKRRAKLREFREKMAAIEHDKREVFAVIDSQENTDGDAMFEAMEKFTEKYGTPESVEHARESRARLQVMRAEMDADSKRLTELKEAHEGNPTEAVAAFRAYAEAYPDSRLAFLYIVSALREAKDFDAAIAMYEGRICENEQSTTNPASPYEVCFDRMMVGSLLTEKGEPIRAVAYLQKLIRETEGKYEILHGSMYVALGEAYHAGGNKAAARKAWNEALKRDNTGTCKETVTERLREIG